jgi:hypothetical protein
MQEMRRAPAAPSGASNLHFMGVPARITENKTTLFCCRRYYFVSSIILKILLLA